MLPFDGALSIIVVAPNCVVVSNDDWRDLYLAYREMTRFILHVSFTKGTLRLPGRSHMYRLVSLHAVKYTGWFAVYLFLRHFVVPRTSAALVFFIIEPLGNHLEFVFAVPTNSIRLGAFVTSSKASMLVYQLSVASRCFFHRDADRQSASWRATSSPIRCSVVVRLFLYT